MSDYEVDVELEQMAEDSEVGAHELIQRLEEVRVMLEASNREMTAFLEKGNKSAGVRARRALRAVKKEVHAIVQESNKIGKE